MSNKKKSFLLHIDSLDILDDLTNGQAGVLFKAIKSYQHEEDFPLDSVVKIAFSPFKNQFFRDDEKYVKTCERRAIAGSKGGKQKVANASNSKQELANVADNKNKNKNKTKNKSDNEVTVTRRFSPPTDIETVAYFVEKGSNNIEAEKFWLFYDSKNWMVGKSKMKKWQSAASGWITRNKTDNKNVDILKLSAESNWEEGINEIF
tara:strand:- start:380 stop:994 length:615 start_codon:yes stop_codon:yes gene_type:complete